VKIVNLKPGEWVQIGEDVFIRINVIKQPRVIIGVQAPLSKLVLRAELADRPPPDVMPNLKCRQ
jgi:sRNA-binding carbon storage regulator CsrA